MESTDTLATRASCGILMLNNGGDDASVTSILTLEGNGTLEAAAEANDNGHGIFTSRVSMNVTLNCGTVTAHGKYGGLSPNDSGTLAINGGATLIAWGGQYALGYSNQNIKYSDGTTHAITTGSNADDATAAGSYNGGQYVGIVVDDPVQEHDGITFDPWYSDDSLPDEAGNFYLTKDVELPEASPIWTVPAGTVNLCLNGYGIKGYGIDYPGTDNSKQYPVIIVQSGATLNLYDCGTTTHTFSVAGGLATVGGAGNSFEGGYITGGFGGDNGGGVYINGNSTFNMFGGTILGNRATNGGAGVRVNLGTFNMYGGRVCYNTANLAGGVRVKNSSTMTLYDGQIDHNAATGGGSDTYKGRGGGVLLDCGGALNLNGGSIESNTASALGDGVFVAGKTSHAAAGAVALSGSTDSPASPKISGNSVYLADGTRIKIDGPVDQDVEIPVKTATKPSGDASLIITDGLSGYAASAENFTSEDTGYRVLRKDGEAVLISSDTPDAKVTVAADPAEGGTVLGGDVYVRNSTATVIATPNEGYDFVGWTKDGEDVAETADSYEFTADGEISIVASFKKQSFTITFVDEDGTELKTGTVAYGETPVYTGETPAKDADAEYHYTFAGWEPALAEVTGEATYTATYESEAHAFEYSITKESSCTETGEMQGTCGVCAYQTTEAKEASGHKLTKTEAKEPTCTEDGSSEYYTCSVCGKFFSDEAGENEIKEKSWVIEASGHNWGEWEVTTEPEVGKAGEKTRTCGRCGKTETEPVDALPEPEPEPAPEPEPEPEPALVKVGFVTADHTEIAEAYEEYPAGTAYTLPTLEKAEEIAGIDLGDGVLDCWEVWRLNPAENEDETLEKRWGEGSIGDSEGGPASVETKKAGESITLDTDVLLAPVIREKITYTVIFVDADGKVLQTGEVAYGETPAYGGKTPTKAATAEKTYVFSGWSPSIVPVTGDATYTAEYSDATNSYTVTWKDDEGKVIDAGVWEYGKTPTHADPTKAADGKYTYTFAGWDPAITAVTGNAEYRAAFTPKPIQYIVSFDANGGTGEMAPVTVDAGTDYELPACTFTAPAGKEFDVWEIGGERYTDAVYTVNADVTLTALFTPKRYTVTFVNEDGTVLQSVEVKSGEIPAYTGTTPTTATDSSYTYTFAGWTPEIVPATADATYTATYTNTAKPAPMPYYPIHVTPAPETKPELPFTDVTKDMDCYDDVKYVYEKGIMIGMSDTEFGPDTTLSRAMLVTVLYRMEGKPSVEYAGVFSDVPAGVWYSDAVEWAAAEGIVLGYGDGTFGVNDDVTREQLATIFWRYAKWKDYDVSVGEDTNILSFNDAFDTSDWAMAAMQWAIGSGVLEGDAYGYLNGGEPATRAEIAAAIRAFLEDVAK